MSFQNPSCDRTEYLKTVSTRIRIPVSCLKLKKGRYTHIFGEEGVCIYCNVDQEEDERLFLYYYLPFR